MGRARILVIDDEEANRSLISSMLQHAGYQSVAVLADPNDLERQLAAQPPDLIILDLHMPDRDGFGVLDALRDAAGQSVPGGGLLTNSVLYIDDHALGLVLASLASALGTALVAPVLAYLYRAARARTETANRAGLYAALIGPILIAVAQITLVVLVVTKASDFASGKERDTEAAHEALQSGAGRLVLKDVMLMAGAWLVVADSARAFLEQTAPVPRRTSWTTPSCAARSPKPSRRRTGRCRGPSRSASSRSCPATSPRRTAS